jgi:hypothetical protein
MWMSSALFGNLLTQTLEVPVFEGRSSGLSLAFEVEHHRVGGGTYDHVNPSDLGLQEETLHLLVV